MIYFALAGKNKHILKLQYNIQEIFPCIKQKGF